MRESAFIRVVKYTKRSTDGPPKGRKRHRKLTVLYSRLTLFSLINMEADSLKLARRTRIRRRHWWAWIGLCAALAVHVADEALTDFLSIYNPTVVELRQRNPALPLPTFSFEMWLSLLVFAVFALTAASYFVWKGRWAMRPISYVFAGVMLLNGLLHIAVSLYMGKLISGVYSSPLLLAASIALIITTRAHNR